MNEEKGRKNFEFNKRMYSLRIQKAKENGWCTHCGGTGFVSHWITDEKTRKYYGNVPQEYSMKCPHCGGIDNTNTLTKEEKERLKKYE